MTEAPHESNRMRLPRELVSTVNSIRHGGPSMFSALVLIERDHQMRRDDLRGYPKKSTRRGARKRPDPPGV
jgi:hypothetical protein